MFRVALLLTLLAVFPAMAEPPTACAKRSDFVKLLSSNYDEAPVAMGLTASGRVLEVVASDHGSWTIIVTRPNGISCGVVSGESWQRVTPAAELKPNA